MNEFESILTRDQLADRLGLTTRALTWWIWALRESRRYHEFEIARRSGGEPRIIQTPIKPIRDMQTTLLPMLEAVYEPRPHVHGFVAGRSAVTNAAIHRGQRWILRLDLKDFFPSINFGRVRGMFMARPFGLSTEVATTLAQICCHKGALPQGAPTSPIISNLICRGLDARLARYASVAHCSYTRYADDLCFSAGRRDFPRLLAEIIDRRPILNPDLRTIIDGEGFVVNEDKTRLMPRHQRQRVTGIVVNKKLNVPREYYRHLRAVLHIWKNFGPEEAEAAFARARQVRNWPPGKTPPEFSLVVRGQVQYLGYVRNYDGLYQRLARQLAECEETFSPTLPANPQPGQVLFAGEGPSDPKHLFAALHALEPEFSGLHFVELEHQRPTTDQQLWDSLEARRHSRNRHPYVGIFDSDSEEFVSRMGPEGWKHLGNGVVAVALARPSWIPDDAPFCIEMLHRPETLSRTDGEGRRIFLRSEFDDAGVTADKKFEMRYPGRQTLVVSNVVREEDGKSVGLGKVAFAEAVYGRVEPYSVIEFDGFRPTLDRLWRAVAVAQTGCS